MSGARPDGSPADEADLDLKGGSKSAAGREVGVATGFAGVNLPFVLTGPHSTAEVLSLLEQLEVYGYPVSWSMLEIAGPFPVAGPATWTDDWHACRDGCTRFHEGLDIFAPRGTPLVAAADGVVTQMGVGELAGLYVEIQDESGVQYLYAHLEAWPEGLQTGQRVVTGDVVGFVGNSGNAISTPTHVHFELQPGGVPVPPKPHVDLWVEEARQRAEAFVTHVTSPPPVTPADTGLVTAEWDAEQMAWKIDWSSARSPEVTDLVDALELLSRPSQQQQSPTLGAWTVPGSWHADGED